MVHPYHARSVFPSGGIFWTCPIFVLDSGCLFCDALFIIPFFIRIHDIVTVPCFHSFVTLLTSLLLMVSSYIAFLILVLLLIVLFSNVLIGVFIIVVIRVNYRRKEKYLTY